MIYFRPMLRYFVLAAFAVSAIALGLAFTNIPATASTITWERDYEKAIGRARAEKKLIIADMFTDWCVLCKDMDRKPSVTQI